MADPFVTTNGEISASALKQELLALIQAKFPTWDPALGDLLVWLAEGVGQVSALVFEQMTELEQAAFKRFGEAIVSIPPVLAAPARVESVWTLIDELGHEIGAGTQVGIPGPEGKPIGFETVGATTVAPGSSKATILLQAIEAGEGGNELSGTPRLETLLNFVVDPGGIELDGVTAGGVDEEDEVAYLNRLVETIRLLSIALILPEDFEVDARSYAGIARAKCIKNYNPEDGTTNNPLMQCVFALDEDNKAIGAPLKAELLAGQQARLIGGVIHHVADPKFTPVDVLAEFVPEAGFDPEAIAATVKARITEYLAKWGLPMSGESAGWVNRTTVYRNELISLVDKVPGVDRVEDVKLAKGGEALGTANVALAGVAPMAEPGSVEVSAL